MALNGKALSHRGCREVDSFSASAPHGSAPRGLLAAMVYADRVWNVGGEDCQPAKGLQQPECDSAVAANAKNVWQGKEGGWFGLFIAGVGVIPLGGDAAKVALKGTRKGLTGAAGGLAQQAAKHANDAGDLAKSAKASVQSPRAARRAATREAGIPTSQQPISQKSVRTPQRQPAGRQYTYETPKPGGGTRTNTNSVQHSLTDQVEGHGPHWEAGPVKPGGQMDSLGRPRIQGGKVKVNE